MKTTLQAFYFKDFNNSYIPHILKEIYMDHVYVPYLQGKKDLIMVDAGANIGLTSYYFKDFAKQVYAIEPAQQHIECMTAMIEQDQIKTIKVCPFALAKENGTAKFYHPDNVTMYSLNEKVNQTGEFEEVQTKTLETFMQEESLDHIDFMKLDVEGSEGELITSEGFKKMASKIKVIVGEWHTWGSMNPNVFASTFRDLGFDFKWLGNTEASVFSAVRV